MLKLDRMELYGFKSFIDRTEIQFRAGITAVVGPNGCGKSNVGDAINWVLGEQSAKLLRGQQMSDVIFGGSRLRKPTGMAEVSLHLSGLNGDPGGTVLLTRRLFRTGESEYLLNGSRVRLKDIQELLRDHRIGAKTYATIEQGRVDQILNAKPRERRLIIEDAAGISGFKHKRRLTELKLEATHANLLRVNDIVTEVRRQINSLKRQASKARRYQRLREELRSTQKLRFGCRAHRMDLELGRLREVEGRAKSAEAELAARLSSFEAELAAERTALDESTRGYQQAADRLHRLDIEVDRAESQIRVSRERIEESQRSSERLADDAESLAERRRMITEQGEVHRQALADGERQLREAEERLAAARSESDAADRAVRGQRERIEALRGELFEALSKAAEERNRRRGLEEVLERSRLQRGRLAGERDNARGGFERLESETARLDGEIEGQAEAEQRLAEQCAGNEAELGSARERHSTLAKSLAEAREQEKSAGARLRTLEDIATRFAGVSDGVRTLLTKGASAGIRTSGVIADFVEAGREIENVAEVYLQGLLPTVIVEEDADARRAAELLRAEGAGRTSVICRSQPAGAVAVGSPGNGNGMPSFPEELLRDRRVLGRLRDRLSIETSTNGVVRDRIGDALLVDSLESALQLHRQHPSVDYLTRCGEVVYASGIVLTGSSTGSDQGLLAHSRRTQETRAELQEAEARSAELQSRVDAARTETDRLAAELQRQRQALEQSRRRRVELELQARRSAEERERNRRRSDVLADELATLDEEAATLGDGLSESIGRVEQAQQAQRELERRLEEESKRLESLEGEPRERSANVASLGADVAVRRQQQEQARRESARLSEALEELKSRIETARTGAESERSRARQAAELLERTEQELVRQLEQRERRRQKVGEAQRGIAERTRGLQERERRLGSRRDELESARERAREAEMARARAESDRQHLDELCREELGLQAGEAAGELDQQTLEQTDPDALEQEIAGIREQLERIGPVNILAIEEFTELEERYRFLTAQKEDLEKSMASLRETIRRINRSSRERFTTAFEGIRRNYREIFQVLFDGGRADLRLEEGEDVLECGIEILAQPPGKRLGTVQLLSGGEKAMSAIALLFAIFRYQPSPFCLLDEVDAALDDANIGRFARMLREYASQTQFVLITHNKLSMESADLLYGITMQEPGVSRLVSMQLQ